MVRAGTLTDALDAIATQVYEPRVIVAVGGGEVAVALAKERGIAWVPTPSALGELLGPEITHVWVLHDDVAPRPDALGAMVEELQRVDASVVGAKLLHADSPETLELVGAATDVFCVPYTGLDQDERDQEQYDVVRDVAYISGACMLVRRDLFLGLGGPDPTMAPNAAGIDFSQRARVAGGRVIVVPSAEVLHRGDCSIGPSWREDAGQIRAMAKTYRPLTLSWVLPTAFLTGLIAALAHTFTDRRTALGRFALAWAWNLRRLPSTVAERRRLQRSRLVGDEELFRYQVHGSVALREVGELLGDRLRARSSDSRLANLVDRGRGFWQQPGFIASLFGLFFVAVATRSIWERGLPVAGFSLPLPESAWATLRSFAGGWNPAGLGSATPMPPVVGAASLVQLVLASKAGLASAVMTAGALVAGLWGAGRMLGRLGIGQWGRVIGALALIGGPAARALEGANAWPGLLALGVSPWAIAVAIRPWPQGWRNRLANVGMLALATGALAVFSPVALILPVSALILGSLLRGGWGSVLRGLVGAVLAVPLLFPWFYTATPESLLSGPSLFWNPSLWTLGLLAVTALLVIGFGDKEISAIAGWGAVLVAMGIAAARTAGLGAGHEVAVAGLVTASLGTALLAGAAVDLSGRLSTSRLLRRILVLVGAVGGVAIAAGALLLIPGGRAGLGPDQFGAQLEFTSARATAHGVDRLLLIGDAADLPGSAREGPGFAYRLIGGPVPTLAEAWLAGPGVGDAALAATLERIGSGDELRPGASLAEFGVRWVVLLDPTPFDQALETQLDMRPLPGLDYAVFESEVPSPRAVTTDGQAWHWQPPGYWGPAAGRVVIRENAHPRWGSGWTQNGWANEVDGSRGVVDFAADPTLRLLAEMAGVYLLLVLAVAVFARKKT
ncbi:hypothetical protein BMS3Bbin01_01135 [bacterium BMS3Bbin01]|nr:hypothetical protein BMS3Bbin01_01135 [bacterium BMS3Bbin01]